MEIKNIYDNGGETLDRFTILFDGKVNQFNSEGFSFSHNPTSGLGVFSHGEYSEDADLGKKIKMDRLKRLMHSKKDFEFILEKIEEYKNN